ncbi:MAG: hypothetical protein GYA14_11315 [Ignavibacteria bacterium]|nr:hypothetical protein [Ignavibacteria bacterium]
MSKKVDVKTSKAHRRKRHWIKGHWAKTSIAFRIKHHHRYPRSTRSQINQRGGTRKQVRNKP